MARERRKNFRVEWNSAASIYDFDGDWSYACVLKDFSNGGAKITEIPVNDVPDRFMLRFHDYLKENQDYQTKYPKQRTEFPPNSVWLVYTDTVPHAVLSGKFALEQTFIIPVKAMVEPQSAPIKVLENLCGRGLAN